MPFKPDPAGRTWVEKVSRTLELIIPFKNNLATLMVWWEENWDKLDVWAESIVKKLDTKMDKKNPVYEGSLNGFKTDYLVIPNNIINTDTRIQIVNKMQEKHLFTYKTDDNVFPNALPSTASKKGVLEVIKVTSTVAYFTYKEDGEIGDIIYTSAYNNGKVTEWTANKGDGYNSVPSGGSANKFLKWAASGVAQWSNITWGDITGKPSNYNPPVATDTVLGGIKTGKSLSLVNEVLDVKFDTNGIGKKMGNDENSSIYIEDGGIHKFGDVFLSKHNPGEFRCKTANSDNYINGDKWIQIDDYTNASKLENLVSVITKYQDQSAIKTLVTEVNEETGTLTLTGKFVCFDYGGGANNFTLPLSLSSYSNFNVLASYDSGFRQVTASANITGDNQLTVWVYSPSGSNAVYVTIKGYK